MPDPSPGQAHQTIEHARNKPYSTTSCKLRLMDTRGMRSKDMFIGVSSDDWRDGSWAHRDARSTTHGASLHLLLCLLRILILRPLSPFPFFSPSGSSFVFLSPRVLHKPGPPPVKEQRQESLQEYQTMCQAGGEQRHDDHPRPPQHTSGCHQQRTRIWLTP